MNVNLRFYPPWLINHKLCNYVCMYIYIYIHMYNIDRNGEESRKKKKNIVIFRHQNGTHAQQRC